MWALHAEPSGWLNDKIAVGGVINPKKLPSALHGHVVSLQVLVPGLGVEVKSEPGVTTT